MIDSLKLISNKGFDVWEKTHSVLLAIPHRKKMAENKKNREALDLMLETNK